MLHLENGHWRSWLIYSKRWFEISANCGSYVYKLADEEAIKGGLTGYIDRQGAMIQMIMVQEGPEHSQLKEGLLRATVYMLDRENVKIIFYKEEVDDIFNCIGFKQSKDISTLPDLGVGKLIIDDIGKDPFSFLEVESFFDHTCG